MGSLLLLRNAPIGTLLKQLAGLPSAENYWIIGAIL